MVAAAAIEFFDVSGAVNFDMAPEAAIAFFQAKGLKPTFAWQDMLGEEHAKAFTVAKMMDVDLLGQVREAVDKAIAEGRTVRRFREELEPLLRARGWWGNQDVVDPVTGDTVSARLGTPARLRTIFRTNIQSAYAVGHWQKVQQNATVAPFLMYDAVDDHRTRPEHKALDNLVLPVDHRFWKTHYPPNGWNCRCSVIQLTRKQLKDFTGKDGPDAAPRITREDWTNPRTGEVHRVPTDLDPGWDFNVGEAHPSALATVMGEKIATLPADLAKAFRDAPEGVLAATAAANAAKLDAGIAAAAGDAVAAQAAEAKAVKAAADLAGQTKLDEIAAGTLVGVGDVFPRALGRLTESGALEGLPAAEQWAKVRAMAEELADAAKLGGAIGGYKQSILEGRAPTAEQAAAFDALDDAGKVSVLRDVVNGGGLLPGDVNL